MSDKDTALISKYMKNLSLTEQEAKDLLQSDKDIDKGKPMPFDLTPEQMKNAKKYIITGAKEQKADAEKTKQTRERKKNETKSFLIENLFCFLSTLDGVENNKVVNPERQISFSIGEENFELNLVQKRKPKK